MEVQVGNGHLFSPKYKRRIYKKFYRALKSGRIKPACICLRCGVESNSLTAHHYDYGKPWNVQWLCRRCHDIIDGTNKKVIE